MARALDSSSRAIMCASAALFASESAAAFLSTSSCTYTLMVIEERRRGTERSRTDYPCVCTPPLQLHTVRICTCGGHAINMAMTHHCECRRFVLVFLGWHLARHHRLPSQLVILHSLVCRVAQLRRLCGLGRFHIRLVCACAAPRV